MQDATNQCHQTAHQYSLSTGINMIYGMTTMIQFRNDFIIMHPIILSWLKYNIVFFTEYKGNCYQSVSNILILQEWTIFRTTQVQSIVCTSAMLKLVTYRFFCTQHQSEASKKVPRCFCQKSQTAKDMTILHQSFHRTRVMDEGL